MAGASVSRKKSIFRRLVYDADYYKSTYANGVDDKRVPVHHQLIFPNKRKNFHHEPAADAHGQSLSDEPRWNSRATDSNFNSNSKASFSQVCCFWCLSLGYHIADFSNEIRCKSYFRYGHVAHFCRNARPFSHLYRVKHEKSMVNGKRVEEVINTAAAGSTPSNPNPSTSPEVSALPLPPENPTPPPPPPQPEPSMASFLVDPQPLVP